VADLDASTSGGAASAGNASITGGASSGGSAGGSETGGAAGFDNTAETCTGTFNACGGDPTGTWDIVSVCVDGNLAAVANTTYATNSKECSNLCAAATLTARGSMTYGSGSVQPNVILSITETLEMTASCYAALFDTTWSSAACTSVAQMLNQQSGTTASCSPGNSSCDCVYTTAATATTDTYTVNGNSLVASDGTTTEFCVQGSTMIQRDAYGNNTYVVTQFSKR